jgi:hypothetical protein
MLEAEADQMLVMAGEIMVLEVLEEVVLAEEFMEQTGLVAAEAVASWA